MLFDDSGMIFEYSFYSDAVNSYLAVKLDSDARLLVHQTEIICRNPNTAFVPFHIRRENENTFVYYGITSKITLSQYLERKGLNRKELLDLLKNINRSLLLYANYLLEPGSFVIHKDFIYVNPATAEVSLLYIPVSFSRDFVEAYKSFLKDLVVNSANVDDSAGDNYLQRILNYLKSDTMNLNGFNRLIMDLRYGGGANEPAPKAAREYIEKSGRDTAFPGADTGDVSCGRHDGKKGMLKVILLQLLIILAAAIAFLFAVSKKSADWGTILGILVIAASLDILVMKRANIKLKGASAGEYGAAAAEEDGNRRVVNAVNKKPYNPGKGRSWGKASAPAVLKACDTAAITEGPPDSGPYLEGVGAHKGDRIIINKDKFVIGRLGSMVDYTMQGNTVGKLHAEITGSREGFCIRDLNSKNGTYVNDVRIPSNKEYEIKNNDRIRFSSYEYIFRQQA